MRPRVRKALWVAAAIIVAVALALSLAVHMLLQPERFTAMLQGVARGMGTELTLAAPASPTVWPRPAIELDGITLRGDNGAPILLAKHGRLVLPWRAVLRRETALSRVELDSPRVDLDALTAGSDRLPHGLVSDAPALPQLDAGLRIQHGTLVRNSAIFLGDVDLNAGTLRSGKAFRMTLAATDAGGEKVTLSLDAMPTLQARQLTLSDIMLHLTADTTWRASLRGAAHWRGAANVDAALSGAITHGEATYTLACAVHPASLTRPLQVALKLDGADDHVDVRLPPLEIATWWQHVAAGDIPLAPPPFTGQVDASHVNLGPAHIEGLHVRSVPDAPAAAASAP
jgi:AsmA protein